MTWDVYRLYRNFLRQNWKLSSQSGIYKLLRLLCKHSEPNSFTLCLQRKNNLKDVGVNFNLYYLRPTSILVYICILLEMLVLPVIPIFCLVVVAVNTLLPVFQSIYAENTHSISKIAIKEFYTKRLFFFLLGLYFEYMLLRSKM